jgi:hypothetical protein
MSIFRRLFGAKQSSPPCEIHTDDRNLVRAEDVAWWQSLSLDDCKALETEDNVFKLAAFKKYTEEEGMSQQDAARMVRVRFPSYYGSLGKRVDTVAVLTAADAKLPYVLKDRVNRAAMNGIIDQDAVESASSVNALVRQLIRSGRM